MVRAKQKYFTPVKKSLRAATFRKYDYKCRWCGTTEKLTIDHIVPKTAGGTNSLDNLQVLCGPCNSSKGNGPNRPFVITAIGWPAPPDYVCIWYPQGYGTANPSWWRITNEERDNWITIDA